MTKSTGGQTGDRRTYLDLGDLLVLLERRLVQAVMLVMLVVHVHRLPDAVHPDARRAGHVVFFGVSDLYVNAAAAAAGEVGGGGAGGNREAEKKGAGSRQLCRRVCAVGEEILLRDRTR